ncbi:MAG: translation initiation factor eIF-2B [Gammaproteobacteria bacterium]|nr:translation initiation factor eIF-2B [Gammaproteobacteria bacterium]
MVDAVAEFRVRLAADRVHGASELARQSLEFLAELARRTPARDPATLVAGLRAAAELLVATRPSMAPLYNLLGCWKDELPRCGRLPLAEARAAAAGAAESVAAESKRAVDRAAGHAASRLGAGCTIATLSLSSTVAAVFEKLREAGVRAIVAESRPLNEGHRLAAALSAWHIPTTLVTDAALGRYAAGAGAVLVGADALTADGAVVNKTGTYPLALAARDNGIPFYVCCESFKRLPPSPEGPELEEMDPAELGAPELPGVRVVNPYFEVTPARLVSAWITEAGVEAGPRASGSG